MIAETSLRAQLLASSANSKRMQIRCLTRSSTMSTRPKRSNKSSTWSKMRIMASAIARKMDMLGLRTGGICLGNKAMLTRVPGDIRAAQF